LASRGATKTQSITVPRRINRYRERPVNDLAVASHGYIGAANRCMRVMNARFARSTFGSSMYKEIADGNCLGGASTSITRRTFLTATAAAAAGMARLSGAMAWMAEDAPPPRQPRAPAELSRVVELQNVMLINGPLVHRPLLMESLDEVLMTLTGKDSRTAAWHDILKPDDVVALKFNRSGARTIATSDAVGDTLIESLLSAGWRAHQIICIEGPPGLTDRFGVRSPTVCYDDGEFDFGSGQDQFASVLDKVSALVSVPFLKTHNMARFTGALKNLSHGLVKHPARFHANGCSPFVADIVAAAPIRSKLRLCIADGLRIVFDKGPEAHVEALSDEGYLVASRDLVALDTVGIEIINHVRNIRGFSPITQPGEQIEYLRRAEMIGLGNCTWDKIDRVRV